PCGEQKRQNPIARSTGNNRPTRCPLRLGKRSSWRSPMCCLSTSLVIQNLSINDQHAAVEELNQMVRASEQFQRAEGANRLIRIPTGDGMVLVFYTSPEAPAQCAVEISRALKEHPRLQLPIGIHSGPVSGVV